MGKRIIVLALLLAAAVTIFLTRFAPWQPGDGKAVSVAPAGVQAASGVSPALAASATAAASAVADVPEPKFSDTPLHLAGNETFQDGETAYVTAPYAVVDMGGTRLFLPIGTPVQVKGECSWSYESEDSDDSAAALLCVYLGELYGDEIEGGLPDGLAAKNRFGHKPPKLAELLAAYDKTPRENKELRREWAEKAVALDPWSKEAHERLIAVLGEIGDQPAIAAAEDTYKRYQEHQPVMEKGELPTLFHYDGHQLKRYATIENGVIKGVPWRTANQPGKFFQVYGDGPVGFVVTTRAVACGKHRCPLSIPVRNLGLDGKPTDKELKGAFAANFTWPARAKPVPAVTSQQKDMLISLLRKKAAADYGEDAEPAMDRLDEGDIVALAGQLSPDGRIFLVGGLQIGSASDEKYSNMRYISEVVVLEQQKDGKFIEAETDAGSLRASYCGITGILEDVSGDGTDEIMTYCNTYVEGPGGDWNGIVQRINNHWVMEF